MPKRATSIAGRMVITLAGAGSLIPFVAATDLMISMQNFAASGVSNVGNLFAAVITEIVGIVTSVWLSNKLANRISKDQKEFFQHVADAFETAVKIVGRKSLPKEKSA